MNNIIKRVWIQNRLVNIEDLTGMVFQAEIGAHTFEISGIDDTGAAVALSGTVSGVFRRPDNADIALTGSASDGVVSVTLDESCYAVPGRFALTIFVTSDGQTVAVYACVGTVAATSGGSVAGDTPESVADLIADIEAAVATIPPTYTDLMASIAPTYSSSALYGVGSYAWYDGDLYRCTTPITTAESWTAAHWTAAVLGDDVSNLKSNFGVISSVNLFNVNDPNNITGKYPDGQGWHDLTTAFTSYPFLLKAGVKYTALTVTTYGSGSRYLAKKCDAEGNLESGSVTGTAISGTNYGVFQSPTDQYVYFKFSKATKDSAMIVYGETAPTEYKPYFEPYTELSEDVQVTDGSLESVTAFVRKDKMPYVSTDIPLQYEIDMDGNYTKGWLKLPSNYTPSGKPVPLIVFVHGSADMVSINSSMTEHYNDYYNYLRDCGYALFDCYAYGNLYTVAGGNTWNTPTNKKCYHQGIEYVCKKYNIDKNNIFVACKSLGGVQALGFYFDTTLSIKAVGMLAPFLDPVQVCGGYTTTQRTAYRDDCGLPADPDGVFINNTSGDALIAYLKSNGNILLNNNPAYYGARKSVDDMIDGSRANTTSSWRNNTECEGIAQRPLKIWAASDDTFYSGALNVCNSLKAGGYGAEVREMPAGCSDPHHAVDTDPDAEQTENVTTRLGVTYESVPTAYYELGKWFDMWLS